MATMECSDSRSIRLGFPVSARTDAKYMHRPYDGVPSPTWRTFLTRHATNIWACDFFGVRTVFFRTLDVFFVMHHETRQILQVRVTRHPTADWAAQQVVETCAWDRDPPRYLIRDRDTRYGEALDRRVRGLGVRQLRTPVKAPRANALAERWVRSVRNECLDQVLIVNERHLQRVLDEYVNDTIFQGGHHGRDSLGRVVRTCLRLDVVPVFAPLEESGFQAAIENFNGRWQAKVTMNATSAGAAGVRQGGLPREA
jgi:putative transposase